MAQIYNSDLSKELREGAKIQISRDEIPNQLAEKVVPVMEVNPFLLKKTDFARSIATNGSGNVSIYLIPTDKQFYLTGIQLGYNKSVACDNADIEIIATINGLTISLLNIPTVTLTASADNSSRDFTRPVKIDAGTNIYCGGAFTVGALSRYAIIQGYFDDMIKV